MTTRWQIDPDDVAEVLAAHDLPRDPKAVQAILRKMDRAAIRSEAIEYDDPGHQRDAAQAEMEAQLRHLGLIPADAKSWFHGRPFGEGEDEDEDEDVEE